MLKCDVSLSDSDRRDLYCSAGSTLSVSAGRRAGRRPVCGVLPVTTHTVVIAGAMHNRVGRKTLFWNVQGTTSEKLASYSQFSNEPVQNFGPIGQA